MQINYDKLKQRNEELGQHGQRSEYLKFEEGGIYQIRPVPFEPAPGIPAELDRKTGNHYKLKNYGAAELYTKDGKPSRRDIDQIRCAAVTLGQYTDPDLANLLSDLDRDNDKICSQAEIDLLERHCVFCGIVERLKRSGAAEDASFARMIAAQGKYLINVILRTSTQPQGAYKLAEISPGLHKQLMKYLTDPTYAARVFTETAREFVIEVTGKELMRRYKLTPTADDVPLGSPSGKIVNLFSREYTERVLRCWSLEEQQIIFNGGTVTRPSRDDAPADTGPPPPCFNTGAKKMTQPFCIQCTAQVRCDNPNAAALPATAAPQAASLKDRSRAALGLPPLPTQPIAGGNTIVPPAAPTPQPIVPPAQVEAPVGNPLEELIEEIKNFDWSYDMSDDPKVFKRGEAAYKRLLASVREELSTGHIDQIYAAWEQYGKHGKAWPYALPLSASKPVETMVVAVPYQAGVSPQSAITVPAPPQAAPVVVPAPPPPPAAEVSLQDKPAAASGSVLAKLRARSGQK